MPRRKNTSPRRWTRTWSPSKRKKIKSSPPLQTVWHKVRLSGSLPSGGLPREFASLTIVKYHYHGAHIAWLDPKTQTYHELQDDYIRWECFPAVVRNYYARRHMAAWGNTGATGCQVGFNGTLRSSGTPVIGIITRAKATGLLLPSYRGNAYTPYSEFIETIRDKFGYYENEAYCPDSPVLEHKPTDAAAPFLMLPARTRFQLLKPGLWIASIELGEEEELKILVKAKEKRLRTNFRSYLHNFVIQGGIKSCTSCGLSSILGGGKTSIYFNFMFERQSRCPCEHAEEVYALIRTGDMEYQGTRYSLYFWDPDFSRKHPRDWKNTFRIPFAKKGTYPVGDASVQETAVPLRQKTINSSAKKKKIRRR